MKNTRSLALLILFAVMALAFTFSNFVAPAQAAPIVIYGTVTYAPWLNGNPVNQFFHLYDDYYCINTEANCSVVTQF